MFKNNIFYSYVSLLKIKNIWLTNKDNIFDILMYITDFRDHLSSN